LKNKNVKIARSHIVKVLKEHVNIGSGHATKVSKYSPEILQTYFETKINQEAHQISDLASQITQKNGDQNQHVQNLRRKQPQRTTQHHPQRL